MWGGGGDSAAVGNCGKRSANNKQQRATQHCAHTTSPDQPQPDQARPNWAGCPRHSPATQLGGPMGGTWREWGTQGEVTRQQWSQGRERRQGGGKAAKEGGGRAGGGGYLFSSMAALHHLLQSRHCGGIGSVRQDITSACSSSQQAPFPNLAPPCPCWDAQCPLGTAPTLDSPPWVPL